MQDPHPVIRIDSQRRIQVAILKRLLEQRMQLGNRRVSALEIIERLGVLNLDLGKILQRGPTMPFQIGFDIGLVGDEEERR